MLAIGAGTAVVVGRRCVPAGPRDGRAARNRVAGASASGRWLSLGKGTATRPASADLVGGAVGTRSSLAPSLSGFAGSVPRDRHSAALRRPTQRASEGPAATPWLARRVSLRTGAMRVQGALSGRIPGPAGAVAVDGEEAVEVGGAKDLIGSSATARRAGACRRRPATLRCSRINLLSRVLETRLTSVKSRTQPDRAAVVGQRGEDLVGGLADGALVEELTVGEPDHLDPVRLAHLDPGSDGHRSAPCVRLACVARMRGASGSSSRDGSQCESRSIGPVRRLIAIIVAGRAPIKGSRRKTRGPRRTGRDRRRSPGPGAAVGRHDGPDSVRRRRSRERPGEGGAGRRSAASPFFRPGSEGPSRTTRRRRPRDRERTRTAIRACWRGRPR